MTGWQNQNRTRFSIYANEKFKSQYLRQSCSLERLVQRVNAAETRDLTNDPHD
jgi:hypothetical protein